MLNFGGKPRASLQFGAVRVPIARLYSCGGQECSSDSKAESKPSAQSTTLPVASGLCIASAGAVRVSGGVHAVLFPKRKISFWGSVTNANSANYRI
jgi:hypothetical protein